MDSQSLQSSFETRGFSASPDRRPYDLKSYGFFVSNKNTSSIPITLDQTFSANGSRQIIVNAQLYSTDTTTIGININKAVLVMTLSNAAQPLLTYDVVLSRIVASVPSSAMGLNSSCNFNSELFTQYDTARLRLVHMDFLTSFPLRDFPNLNYFLIDFTAASVGNAYLVGSITFLS